jgi:CheY-like chemotaxis protein
MPKVDGIELLEWVRRNRPHVRTVVVTAHGGESCRRFVLQQGALRFVAKPVDTEVLVDLFRVANQLHGFVGSLQEANLVEYLKTVCRAKRSLKLEVVVAGGATGALFVRKGSLVHARYEESEGMEALEAILEATHGTYAVYPWEHPPHRSIHEEAAWILDSTGYGASPRRETAPPDDH